MQNSPNVTMDSGPGHLAPRACLAHPDATPRDKVLQRERRASTAARIAASLLARGLDRAAAPELVTLMESAHDGAARHRWWVAYVDLQQRIARAEAPARPPLSPEDAADVNAILDEVATMSAEHEKVLAENDHARQLLQASAMWLDELAGLLVEHGYGAPSDVGAVRRLIGKIGEMGGARLVNEVPRG